MVVKVNNGISAIRHMVLNNGGLFTVLFNHKSWEKLSRVGNTIARIPDERSSRFLLTYLFIVCPV